MLNMFKQLFTAITTFFMATENAAAAINHLSVYAREAAAALEDEARYERQLKRQAQERKLSEQA